MTETENLVLEILKKMQADFAAFRAEQRTMSANIIGIRQQLHTMEGNALRQEAAIAELQMKVERIETRLELHDGPALHT